MTTIVYHHKSKTLAVDSRMCGGDMIELDNYDKIHANSSGLWVLSGDIADIEEFINLKDDEVMSGESPSVCGFFITNGIIKYTCLSRDFKRRFYSNEHNSAEGSGRKLAIAAMDFGCDAGEAVAYAAKRDIYTGGTIRTINIETGDVSIWDDATD